MKYILYFFLFAFSTTLSQAQTILWEEDFEEPIPTTFEYSNTFFDSCNDYFKQTDGSDLCISSCTDIKTYQGQHGVGFWAGEDHDDASMDGDELDEKFIYFPVINTENYTGLTFSGLFAAGNNCGDENSAYDDTDYIHIYYVTDTKDTILFLSFEAEENNLNQANEPLAQDTNFDGIGDGLELNETFQTFSTELPALGSLKIIIEMHLDSDKEEAAFDYFKIEGVPCKKPVIGNIVVQQDSNCPGSGVTLTLSDAQLNDASEWFWFDNSCSENSFKTGATIDVFPTTTTEYFVKGIGNCVENSICKSIIIKVEDTAPPVVTHPESIVLYYSENCTFIIPDITDEIVVVDNCSSNLINTQNILPGDYTETIDSIKISSSDQYGNTFEVAIPLILKDSIPPRIVTQDKFVIELFEGCNTVLGNLLDSISILDNCSIKDLTQSIPLDSLLTVGIHEITFSATDNFGNSSILKSQIEIIDNILPKISGPDQFIRYLDSNCSYLLEDFINDFEITDNCENGIITQNPPPGVSIVDSNTIIEIYTEDLHGNSNVFETTLTLLDTIPPTIISSPEVLNINIENCDVQVPDLINEIEVMDNCTSLLVFNQVPKPGTLISSNSDIYFSASDESGNRTEITIPLTITDVTEPILECPEDIMVYSHEFIENYTHLLVANDNCESEITLHQTPELGENPANYSEIIFTATDSSGNISTCYSQISVVTSIDELNSQIKIYPNPSSNYINITGVKNSTITLINTQGEKIFSTIAKSELYLMQTSEYSSGTYLLKIDHLNKHEIFRIILK